MKKSILLITLILFGASVGLAQRKMYEPAPGSAERKALMDAIRAYDAGRDAALNEQIFKVHALRVKGDWAYANVGRMNVPDARGSTLHAFLRRTGAGWKVMWSDYNDDQEVGVEALTRLRKKYKDFNKQLADFAIRYLAE